MKDSAKLLILFVLGSLGLDILTINDNQAVWNKSQRLNTSRRLGGLVGRSQTKMSRLAHRRVRLDEVNGAVRKAS